MKRTLVWISFLVFSLAGAAFAGTVNLTFTGPEGNNLGGLYTYPYYFQINGTGQYSLLCDTFTNEISTGDHWQANAFAFQNLNSSNVANLEFGNVNGGGAGAVEYYMAAAYLFEEQMANPNNGEYNWAVWYLFQPSQVTSSSFWGELTSAQQSAIEGYESAAITAVAGDHPSDFAGVVIYTPQQQGTYQEFMGYDTPNPAPEPSSLLLFGSGILGIAGLLRKRRLS